MFDLLINEPMLNALLLIYQFLGQNFGVAIIIFTVVIRLVMYPLTRRQQLSSMKMQELQKSKKYLDIQKKYAKDKQKQQEETMKLFQEAGINPLSGCLPLLIQLPIWFGLITAFRWGLADTPLQLLDLGRHIYSSVSSSLIPLNSQFLWMDLGQPERLYLPFLPTIGIPVLTILVVITSWLQAKIATPPSADGQAAQMNQSMTTFMPLMMGWLSYSYASGLALYFVVSNVLGIVQYAVTGRVDWRSLIPWGKKEA
jgi:YidC/Oxa1 family membrane protein insertase